MYDARPPEHIICIRSSTRPVIKVYPNSELDQTHISIHCILSMLAFLTARSHVFLQASVLE